MCILFTVELDDRIYMKVGRDSRMEIVDSLKNTHQSISQSLIKLSYLMIYFNPTVTEFVLMEQWKI
jgi:hypothetical protein